MRYRLALLLLTTIFSSVVIADEGQLYNSVGTVRGQVTIENHPDLGRTPCAHCSFLLQFNKCKQALIYVQTDAKGQYRVRIGHGRWNVLMRDIPPEFSGEESPDMLAPKQPHYVDEGNTLSEEQFDIIVHLPKR